MMKLLKYDWKRNSNVILGLMTVLLISETLFTSIGYTRGWELWLLVLLSMLAYGIVSTILLVIICRTFDQNIKLYNRRLLPIRSIWTIVSSLIQAWISTVIVMILVIIHLWIFWNIGSLGKIINLPRLITSDYVLMALGGGWKYTFVMITIFFSIVVARAIRKQWGLWFSIVLFFIIQNVIQWMEYKIFTSDSGWVGQTFSIRIEEGGTGTPITNETFQIPWGPFIFEILLAGVLIYAMVKLIDRKVEV
ncbi:hypothetical protein ACK8P5_22905 [Paenibacillus sp. EC2-1]|uniref:hypothetical protein n=1 Tax=Paenibacillus sp. EC2-1 TaxID=3388665 RepID=UPI003BEEF1E7